MPAARLVSIALALRYAVQLLFEWSCSRCSSLGTSILYYIDDTISIYNIHILTTVFLLSFYMDDNRQRCYNYGKMEEVYAYVNQ